MVNSLRHLLGNPQAAWTEQRRCVLDKRLDFDFGDLCRFVEHELLFIPHPNSDGSHRVYGKPGILEIINLQPNGHEAKSYQVRQVRKIMVDYGL